MIQLVTATIGKIASGKVHLSDPVSIRKDILQEGFIGILQADCKLHSTPPHFIS